MRNWWKSNGGCCQSLNFFFIFILFANKPNFLDCRPKWNRKCRFSHNLLCNLVSLSAFVHASPVPSLSLRTSAHRLLTAFLITRHSSAPHWLIKSVCLLHTLHLIPHSWQIIVAALSRLIIFACFFLSLFSLPSACSISLFPHCLPAKSICHCFS